MHRHFASIRRKKWMVRKKSWGILGSRATAPGIVAWSGVSWQQEGPSCRWPVTLYCSVVRNKRRSRCRSQEPPPGRRDKKYLKIVSARDRKNPIGLSNYSNLSQSLDQNSPTGTYRSLVQWSLACDGTRPRNGHAWCGTSDTWPAAVRPGPSRWPAQVLHGMERDNVRIRRYMPLARRSPRTARYWWNLSSRIIYKKEKSWPVG